MGPGVFFLPMNYVIVTYTHVTIIKNLLTYLLTCSVKFGSVTDNYALTK